MIHKEEFITEISDYMSKQDLSLRSFSDEVKIPYNNLRRFLKEGRVPKPNEIISIAKSIGKESKIVDYFKAFYPDRPYLHNGVAFRSGVEYLSEEIENLFLTPEYFPIISQAFQVGGVSVNKIREEFGNKGLKYIEDLLENKAVTLKDGHICGVESYKSSTDVAKKKLKLAVDFHDSSKIGTGENFFSYSTGKASLSKKKWIMELLMLSRKAINENLDNNKISLETQNSLIELIKNSSFENKIDNINEDTIFVGIAADDFNVPFKSSENKELLQ